MPETKEAPPPTVEVTEVPFSRLEASLAQAEVAPRPNSREMKDMFRHAQTSDLAVNELDFDFNLDSSHYPLGGLQSLQQVFDAVQYETHLSNPRNFSDQTLIECLEVNESDGAGWRDLDEDALHHLLETVSTSNLSAPNTSPKFKPTRKLLAFFVPLTPTPNTSFGSQISMSRSSTMDLFKSLKLNPLLLLNLVGRPDYWAPSSYYECNNSGMLSACDFFCQHPRWNLQVQGAPLSVYMRYDAIQDLTTYVISHKQNDTSIQALRNMVDIAIRTASGSAKATVFLDDPFDFHVLFSTLSFEASKYHVKRFQRFMWTQINKVDDHLAGLETSDRAKLGALTKQLQIISQNADSHIGNVDVAIITVTYIRSAHARLHAAISTTPFISQRATDSIAYVIQSMEKQKIWFLNYKTARTAL